MSATEKGLAAADPLVAELRLPKGTGVVRSRSGNEVTFLRLPIAGKRFLEVRATSDGCGCCSHVGDYLEIDVEAAT